MTPRRLSAIPESPLPTTDPTPTAEDRARARAVSPPCWYSSQDEPDATCESVGAPDRCHECQTAGAIARLLAQVRAEEREACAAACEAYATEAEIIGGTATGSAARGCAAAIRARGGGA